MGDMIDMMELAVDVVGTADSLSSVDVSIFIWHWYNASDRSIGFPIDSIGFRIDSTIGFGPAHGSWKMDGLKPRNRWQCCCRGIFG